MPKLKVIKTILLIAIVQVTIANDLNQTTDVTQSEATLTESDITQRDETQTNIKQTDVTTQTNVTQRNITHSDITQSDITSTTHTITVANSNENKNKLVNEEDIIKTKKRTLDITNEKIEEHIESLNKTIETRRKIKKQVNSISTSSSANDKDSKSKANLEDLEMTTSTEEEDSGNKFRPKSSNERKGWRKWHRKCQSCPEDIRRKWRDPRISWICGGYQRARRSFKSLCMMHYRNCQDGTMFVKLYDQRCKNDSYYGHHFFYDYKVALSHESSDITTSEEDSSSNSKSKDEEEFNFLLD